MTRTLFGLALLSLLVACSGAAQKQPPTQAQSQRKVEEALSQFGLLGVWATNCADRTTVGTYSAVGGHVTLQSKFPAFGRTTTQQYIVEGATRLSDSQIILHLFRPSDQKTGDTVIEKAAGRIHVLSFKDDDTGQLTIRDGKRLFGGQEMPWFEHCD